MNELVYQHLKRLSERPKIHRDFSFLFAKQPQWLDEKRIAKYILVEGQGETLKQLSICSFKAYFSYIKYDYDGKRIQQNPVGKVMSNWKTPLTTAILSMKINEKSWFNISATFSPQTKSLLDDDLKQKPEDFDNNQNTNKEGCHYEIILEGIEYKNCQNIEIKRHINSQSKEKGERFMNQKRFFDAAIAYKSIISISEKISKRLFSEEEQEQIQCMNINAKHRFLACYFKIQNTNHVRHLFIKASKYLDYLLITQNQSFSVHCYHAKMLQLQRKPEEAIKAMKRAQDIWNFPTKVSNHQQVSQNAKEDREGVTEATQVS